MDNKTAKRVLDLVCLVGVITSIALCIYCYRLGVFHDKDALSSIINGYTVLGPLIFIGVQLIQVVVPIIPGGVSIILGIYIFGPFWGFLYNYLGIIIGSFILFFLGRTYGKPFVKLFVKEKIYNKYIEKLTDSKKWDRLFTILIFLPIAPDDALVMLTSLTDMTFKKFSIIILLGKPVAIGAYSLILYFFTKEIGFKN